MTTREPHVFYRGQYIEVSALHCFGAARVVGTRVPVRILAGRLDSEGAEAVAADYELRPEQVRGAVAEWRASTSRIRWAERKARIWSDGYWCGRRKEATP